MTIVPRSHTREGAQMKVSKKVFTVFSLLAIAFGSLHEAWAHSLAGPRVQFPVHHALLLTKPVFFKAAPRTNRNLFTPLGSSRATQAQLFALLGGGKHAPFVPLAVNSFTSFATPAIPSLSARAFFQQYSGITSKGIEIGESFTPNFTGGVVTDGELKGHLYLQVFNRLYFNTGTSVFAFGSNPLNTGMTGPIVRLPNASNFLNFAANGGGPAHGGIPTEVFGLGNPTSVASRSIITNYKLVSRAAVGLGSKLAPTGFTGGPILGGEFSGTFYLGGAPQALSIDNFVFAFGNNPLNRPTFPFIRIFNPTNEVNFVGRPNDFFSIGNLFGTGYFRLPFTRSRFFEFGPSIFAIGGSPLNTGEAFRLVAIRDTTSFLKF
jgi:hypothetical protein